MKECDKQKSQTSSKFHMMYIPTKVSEECASSIFRTEDGGTPIFRIEVGCCSLPIEDSYFRVLTAINI
jgi:hypothetical protein